jgi:hypothetical protein
MRARTIVIFGVVAVALIGLVKWSPWRSHENTTAPAETAPTETALAPGSPAVAPLTRPLVKPATRPPATGNLTEPAPAATTAAVPNLITNWAERIDELLLSADPESKKGEQLLEMLPNLPLDGQEQAAQHMVNLLSDEQFSKTARYLNDTNTPETVITLLMNDMLNRPDTVKLPMLLDLAQVTGHPLAEESKTILGIYVEKDFGDNWGEWRQGIEEYLKKEAAMSAAENAPAQPPPADTPPPGN